MVFPIKDSVVLHWEGVSVPFCGGFLEDGHSLRTPGLHTSFQGACGPTDLNWLLEDRKSPHVTVGTGC